VRGEALPGSAFGPPTFRISADNSSQTFMAKFLLLLALGIVVYLIVSRMRNDGERPRSAAPPPKSSTAEDMVRCAVCKVHLPRSESFVSRGQYYCSDEHMKLAKQGSERS
jgi:uncharacterized protein